MENLSYPCAFVSCDIIGHSKENISVQRKRIIEINTIVQKVIFSANPNEIIWASGGDGGHIAFTAANFAVKAVDLIATLRLWSVNQEVPLRIVASCGEVQQIVGADGRRQLLGEGINLAGRLLTLGDQDRVVVTSAFRAAVAEANIDHGSFHDEKGIRLQYFPLQRVQLFSIKNKFQSVWEKEPSEEEVKFFDDHDRLKNALDKKDILETTYVIKRLMQINPDDTRVAIDLEKIASTSDFSAGESNKQIMINLIMKNEFIRAAQLVERKKGDIICEYGDSGNTMFFILNGKLGGHFSKKGTSETIDDTPDFELLPGDLVGELAFILNRKRSASLNCLEDTNMLSFDFQLVRNLFSKDAGKKKLMGELNDHYHQRILEHLCNTLNFLKGNSDNPGPLIEEPRPWNILIPHSAIIELSWKANRERTISIETEDIKEEGIYILISGVLENADGEVYDGNDQPILFVNLKEYLFTQNTYRLLNNDVIKILKIEAEGLFEFGLKTYDNIVQGIKETLGVNLSANNVMAAPDRNKVFISYSHQDRNWLDSLKRHLKPLEGNIDFWDDSRIKPGEKWQDEIMNAIDATRIALLLISADFFNSKFIAESELPPLVKAAYQNGATILIVILKPCLWEDHPQISTFQLVNDPANISLSQMDEATQELTWVKVVKEIKGIMTA